MLLVALGPATVRSDDENAGHSRCKFSVNGARRPYWRMRLMMAWAASATSAAGEPMA
jgi:hypothetical protein